jgi:hypothetical protein
MILQPPQINLLLQLVDAMPIKTTKEVRLNTSTHGKLSEAFPYDLEAQDGIEAFRRDSEKSEEICFSPDEESVLRKAIEAGLDRGMNAIAARRLLPVLEQLDLEA